MAGTEPLSPRTSATDRHHGRDGELGTYDYWIAWLLHVEALVKASGDRTTFPRDRR